MKNLIIFLFALTPIFVWAQGPQKKPLVKTEETLNGKKCIRYVEWDKRGNILLSIQEIENARDKNLNKLFNAQRYDHLDRDTLNIFALDGLDLIENVYDQNRILVYFSYLSLNEKELKALYSIRSAKELWELESCKSLLAQKRELMMMYILDSSSNVTQQLFFDPTGDTIETTHQYNSSNKLIKSVEKRQHFITSTEYYTLDDRMNMIHSTKVEWIDEYYDTTEVYNKTYNADSLTLSESFYFRGEFRYKNEFSYNEKRELVKTIYYNEDESTPMKITTFEYNKQGLKIRETIEDFSYTAPKKETHTFRYTYW